MNLSATYEGSGHLQSATDGKHVLGGACSLVALHGPAGFPSVSRVRPEMARRTADTHSLDSDTHRLETRHLSAPLSVFFYYLAHTCVFKKKKDYHENIQNIKLDLSSPPPGCGIF